jgi:hypothetical protein
MMVHFLMTYLGIPLSVTKLPKPTPQHHVDRAADHLVAWKGKLLHQSGPLNLVKATLFALLIHTASCIELPPWLLMAFCKIMTAFLWTDTEVVQSGKCLVAWEWVQRPL